VKLFRTTLMVTALVASVFAEPVMKVTLKSGVSEKKISEISKIALTADGISFAGLDFLFSEISSISFYDDGVSISNHFQKMNQPVAFSNIGSTLNLSLNKNQMMTVRMYAINGRMVKELFSGINTGSALSLSYDGVAPGVYSVVVRMGNEMLARKIMVK